MVILKPAVALAALVAATTAVQASTDPDRFQRRAAHKHIASSSASAASPLWTTIDGKQYPTELGPDAPAPVIQDNWWLDEVSTNDTKLHSFKYSKLPKTSEDGQQGTNICKKGHSSQDSMCQTVLLNGADDFCLWGPPQPNTNVSVSEQYEVAWCTQDHGARLIPEGTLSSVHFVKTSAYVQVTGTGDLTKLNIAAGDEGGELDPHGATGSGNPIGGLVYTTAFSANGKHEQIFEWMSEISATDFCFRACRGHNATSQMLCSHIYDEMGCGFIMPTAPSAPGVFESCDGDVALAPGIISTYTFTQGDPVTPSPRSPAASSNCKTIASPSPPVPVSAAGSALASGGHNISSAGSAATANQVPAAQTFAQKAVATGGAGSSSTASSSASSTSGANALAPLSALAWGATVLTVLLNALVVLV
ncbi:unnamed protein product [Parajaminaea phylloscopi]